MKVSNPLTIIAIFAGVAETLATVALIQLPVEIQSTFVYFVMAFPASIVLLFFFVLYFKNTVLYAPSDFDDQSHYLEANNLKDKVNNELDSIFKGFNKHGSKLSQEEVERAKSSVTKTITKETMPSLMRQIFSLVTEKPLSIHDIANSIGVTRQSIIRYLQRLEEGGLVERVHSGNGTKNLWKAST